MKSEGSDCGGKKVDVTNEVINRNADDREADLKEAKTAAVYSTKTNLDAAARIDVEGEEIFLEREENEDGE